MKNLKKLTLLHSNDMHGDFLAEDKSGKLTGGVSMLSGYIQKVRAEEENVLYAISGDMFRGSIIDSEFMGLSTIEIMNMLAPDVATLGNHEIDYGVGHMLFLEKCARFPRLSCGINGKILYSSSYAIVGTMVIRTSYKLTNEQQFEIANVITGALTALAQSE